MLPRCPESDYDSLYVFDEHDEPFHEKFTGLPAKAPLLYDFAGLRIPPRADSGSVGHAIPVRVAQNWLIPIPQRPWNLKAVKVSVHRNVDIIYIRYIDTAECRCYWMRLSCDPERLPGKDRCQGPVLARHIWLSLTRSFLSDAGPF